MTPMKPMILSLFIFATGCDKLLKKNDDKSDEANNGPVAEPDLSSTGAFLSMADFPKTDLKQITNDDALETLKSSSDVYFNSPDDSAFIEKSLFDRCFEQLPMQYKALNKSTAGLEGQFDLLSCLKNPDSAGSEDFANFTGFAVRVVTNRYCSYVDLTGLAGKVVSSIENSIEDELDKSCHEAENISTIGNATFEAKAVANNQEIIIKTNLAMMSSDGMACLSTKTESGRNLGDCIFAEYTQTESRDGDAVSVERGLLLLEASELTVGTDPKAQWYSGGKFNVTANNITGFLTYSSPATPPAYSLSNGSNGITGTLNPDTSTFLSLSRNLSKSFLKNRFARLFHGVEP